MDDRRRGRASRGGGWAGRAPILSGHGFWPQFQRGQNQCAVITHSYVVLAAGLLAMVAFVARNAGLETELACSRLPGRYHLVRRDEVVERAPEGSFRDFGPHPPMDVALRRVREALEILEDERPQPVWLNPRARRGRVEQHAEVREDVALREAVVRKQLPARSRSARRLACGCGLAAGDRYAGSRAVPRHHPRCRRAASRPHCSRSRRSPARAHRSRRWSR